mmetsp:Transcript_12817/g.11628  ORF Transcript_12817/g.11628 Transcript_12817/m.11628 type:complete len:82 (+) Transcript_12817:53-298(+)
MVFSGQDAWRKHPSISGRWKKPLPFLGLATSLFIGFVIIDSAINVVTAPPKHEKKVLIKYKEAGDFGDTMPDAKLIKKSHH